MGRQWKGGGGRRERGEGRESRGREGGMGRGWEE